MGRYRRLASLVAAGLALFGLSGPAYAYDPASGDYSKIDPLDVRVLTYNTYQTFIIDPERDAAYNRILAAINPDIIVFQEIAVSVSSNAVVNRLNSVLPNGTSWYVNDGLSDGYSRVVTASRYPLSLQRTDTTPPSSTRGVNLCLVDLPDGDYSLDLYMLGVHLKAGTSGSDEDKRQRSCDAIASWLGDARTSGDYINLPVNTPMIVTGDFNFYSSTPAQEVTLRTGDIDDNGTFGPDIKGDWDVTDIAELRPTDPFTGDTDTYSSNYSNPNSRLDRFYYTDSAMAAGARFILNTLTMSYTARSALGLNVTDTTSSQTSDHLPVVMDVRLAFMNDCNQNGIDDLVDIAQGTSEDCDGNDVPDECDNDTDADGFIDACDNCPGQPNPGQFDTDGNGTGDACQCNSPYADTDADTDVDQSDFGRLQMCLTGVEPIYDESCLCLDNDHDGDVDGVDVLTFTGYITGPE